MKKLLVLSILLFCAEVFAMPDMSYLPELNGTHDLSLPDWGPYTKRYIGVSHITDVDQGTRFDLSVFPGYYRRKVFVPNVFYESGYHPWEASPNFEYFSFRHEIEWQDEVYTDVSYSEIDKNSRLVRVECVNNTDLNQSLALHFMASLHFPPIKAYSPYTPLYMGLITLPAKAVWIDALDYQDLTFINPRPQDNLVYDGKMRAEIRDDGFVNGSGIGLGFGADKGDKVSYVIKTDVPVDDAVLYIRYNMSKNHSVTFNVTGMVTANLTLSGNGDFAYQTIDLGKVYPGSQLITLESQGGSAVELDGMTVISKPDVKSINIVNKDWDPVPEILDGPTKNSIILKYKDIDLYYGISWDFDMFQIREWYMRDLGDYFKQMSNEHVKTVFKGEGKGHFTNIFFRPVNIEPRSTKIINGLVCCGTKEKVESYLSDNSNTAEKYDSIYKDARSHLVNLDANPEGEKYKFSIERMTATTTCNVVYPVYTQKQYIRHSAPGRWWDCLYTWDSGFIGIGLLQLDERRAVENLNAYVNEPGAQSAFIHHGTPVPVQHYLFLELWNQLQSTKYLEYFYPRLKQYHEFMAGRLGSSSTRTMKSNLLKTWDYFYNSGGWDDYPPQKYLHEQRWESNVTPVVTTAHVIRTAKILKMAATQLGLTQDIKAYDKDIEMFSKALQKYSWDEDSGYFGYVVHNEKGKPEHIMKYEDKVNYNMGLGGAYPLFSGICDDEQKQILLEKLKSDKHIWSQVGLSAVDQSAPYYRTDGYWNGTVWLSHQWFFWKSMLDLGEGEFAFKIAKTALETWKREVEASYTCAEHFLIETGRGAGWHEFGGLSAPVLDWYTSYFRPGHLTTGLDVWTNQTVFDKDNTELSTEFDIFSDDNKTCSVVVCMNPEYSYKAVWNGVEVPVNEFAKGTLSIDLPIEKLEHGSLKVTKAN